VRMFVKAHGLHDRWRPLAVRGGAARAWIAGLQPVAGLVTHQLEAHVRVGIAADGRAAELDVVRPAAG